MMMMKKVGEVEEVNKKGKKIDNKLRRIEFNFQRLKDQTNLN